MAGTVHGGHVCERLFCHVNFDITWINRWCALEHARTSNAGRHFVRGAFGARLTYGSQRGLLIDEQRPLIRADCTDDIGLRARLAVRQYVSHEHPLFMDHLAHQATAVTLLGFAATAHQANAVFFVSTGFDDPRNSLLKERVGAKLDGVKVSVGQDFLARWFAAQAVAHEDVLDAGAADPLRKFFATIIFLISRPRIGAHVNEVGDAEWSHAPDKAIPAVGGISDREQVHGGLRPFQREAGAAAAGLCRIRIFKGKTSCEQISSPVER